MRKSNHQAEYSMFEEALNSAMNVAQRQQTLEESLIEAKKNVREIEKELQDTRLEVRRLIETLTAYTSQEFQTIDTLEKNTTYMELYNDPNNSTYLTQILEKLDKKSKSAKIRINFILHRETLTILEHFTKKYNEEQKFTNGPESIRQTKVVFIIAGLLIEHGPITKQQLQDILQISEEYIGSVFVSINEMLKASNIAIQGNNEFGYWIRTNMGFPEKE